MGMATELKIAELLKAKRQVMQRYELTDEEWTETMVEMGCRFGEEFARLFTNPVHIKEAILKGKHNEQGQNWFWHWWLYRYMQDDMAIMKSPVYYEPVRYLQLKDAMIADEKLETDLHEHMMDKGIY